jgi:CoA:oxalate CoA-transferase
MTTPLKNVKVLDLTRVLAGPYSTMVLADLGAEVIKVEMPGTGDDSRGFGPYINGESAYYMSINRNKKSITLNLKDADAKNILSELIKKVDVIVENFKPGTMEKLGFGYEDVIKIKPDIIYAACSGFGHSGPYMKKPAYDAIVQAMGGIMSVTGQIGGEPTRVGASIGDITSGIFTSVGILTALYHKQSTGEGQKIDVAMLDCQVAILENAISRYLVNGEIPKPKGNRHPSVTPFEPFEAKDGNKIVVAIGNDKLWMKFCEINDREDLMNDNRFKTNTLRTEHYDDIKPIMDDIMKQKNSYEWLDLFDEHAVPATEVNSVDKVINHPQIIARDMIVEVEHPVVGNFRMPGIPIKMSKTPGAIRYAAPVLGADTETILKDMLGFDDGEIQNLRDQGTI